VGAFARMLPSPLYYSPRLASFAFTGCVPYIPDQVRAPPLFNTRPTAPLPVSPFCFSHCCMLGRASVSSAIPATRRPPQRPWCSSVSGVGTRRCFGRLAHTHVRRLPSNCTHRTTYAAGHPAPTCMTPRRHEKKSRAAHLWKRGKLQSIFSDLGVWIQKCRQYI